MTPIARRIFLGTLLATFALAPLSCFQRALAMDALPDAHFVGFAQAVNDFGISSGKLALARSANDIVRDYAARAIAEHTTAAQSLSKSRSDAGVSDDGKMGPVTANALAQLSALQGPQFDAAFANVQVAVQTAAVHQFSAYSQNGTSGPLRRYAKLMLPTSKMFLEYAHRLAASRQQAGALSGTLNGIGPIGEIVELGIEHNTHSLMLRQAGRDMLEEAQATTEPSTAPRAGPTALSKTK